MIKAVTSNNEQSTHVLSTQERARLFLRACEILGIFADDEAQPEPKKPQRDSPEALTDSEMSSGRS
jgi:hypothetical protein